jgi:hypothetical protein
VDTSGDGRRTDGQSTARSGQLWSLAMIVIFDVAAPLVAYNELHSAGLSAVTALVLSGVFPALGVAIGAVRNRRLDVVGAVVLAGIVLGTVLGLVSHNARLVLVEGSVPTAFFGVVSLGSLLRARPLMFTVVLEFAGPDSARGREMTRLWNHEEAYRRDVRIVTAVWGAAFLLEAAVRVVIVYNASTGTALTISKAMPFVVGGVVSAWTVGYGAYRKRKIIRMATRITQLPGSGGPGPASPDVTRVTDLT